MIPIHQERLQVGILKLKVTCCYQLRYHRSVYEEHLVSSLSCCCGIIIRNHDTRTPFLFIMKITRHVSSLWVQILRVDSNIYQPYLLSAVLTTPIFVRPSKEYLV